MLESMAEWMSYPMYYSFDGAPPPVRSGASHATIYPYGPFTAGDGKTVILGLQNEREWQVFCEQVLRQPGLATDPRFVSNSGRSAARRELRALILEAFAPLTIDEVVARLDEAKIANAHMNDMADLWRHPQLRARNRWVDVESPAGTLPALLPPGIASADEVRMDAIPALGQHTESILAELGFDPEKIAGLRARKVI
jgi:itaconate CoA-transferase